MIKCSFCEQACWFNASNDLAFCLNPECLEFDRDIIAASLEESPLIGVSLKWYLKYHNRLDKVLADPGIKKRLKRKN